MAQFALGDIKYTKRAANNTVHREKLHGAIHFGRHKITQRAVNNTVHQAKFTEIGQLTLDHIHAHTHKLCTVDGAIHFGKHKCTQRTYMAQLILGDIKYTDSEL